MERAEAAGLGVAVVGHIALLAALTLGLFSVAAPPPPAPSIEVSFVEDVALEAASPTSAAAPPPATAPELGPVEQAPVASEPQPAERAAPAPLPSRPTPEPVARPPRESDARDRRRPEEARQTPGQRNRAARLADLNLDNLGRDPARPAPPAAAPASMTGAQRASIRSLIARALIPCEAQPFPTPEARAIRVDVRVSLSRSGDLVSADIVRVLNGNPALERYEQRMRDLALAVVRSCTPITGLPREFYDVPGGWRQFTYRFPRDS